MREIKIIYSDTCSKCHQMMKFLPKWCEENDIMYSEENYEESLYKDEITSLPMIVFKDNMEEWCQITKMDMETFISIKDQWTKN